MIKFLKLQYKAGKIDEEYLDSLVSRNKITAAQKLEIMGE
jgi:hypothetical protein